MNARRSVGAVGRASPSSTDADEAFEEGRRNAATRIQAMQRGRAARRESDHRRQFDGDEVDENEIIEDYDRYGDDVRPGSRDLGPEQLNFNDATASGDIVDPGSLVGADSDLLGLPDDDDDVTAAAVADGTRSPSPEPLVDEMGEAIQAEEEEAEQAAAAAAIQARVRGNAQRKADAEKKQQDDATGGARAQTPDLG